MPMVSGTSLLLLTIKTLSWMSGPAPQTVEIQPLASTISHVHMLIHFWESLTLNSQMDLLSDFIKSETHGDLKLKEISPSHSVDLSMIKLPFGRMIPVSLLKPVSLKRTTVLSGWQGKKCLMLSLTFKLLNGEPTGYNPCTVLKVLPPILKPITSMSQLQPSFTLRLISITQECMLQVAKMIFPTPFSTYTPHQVQILMVS